MRYLRLPQRWFGIVSLVVFLTGCSFIRDFGQFSFDDAAVPTEENACDGADDDGDGVIDEGITRICGTDVGECTAGVETCVDGSFGECEGAVEPGAEVCDGAADEDCDGSVDEGCACTPGTEQPCGQDVGECRFGMQTCQNDATWGECMGGQGPMAEACDGVDNDCDAKVDEAPADATCTFGCNVDAGRCNNCPVGGSECIDAETVRLCPDGSSWMNQGCEHGCNATRNECNVCNPNSYGCADADNEYQCLADGSDWGSPSACDLGCEMTTYHRCRQCDPTAGMLQCSPTNPDIRIDCNALGFVTGGLSCPAAYSGPEPDGCNPATGRCYHE